MYIYPILNAKHFYIEEYAPNVMHESEVITSYRRVLWFLNLIILLLLLEQDTGSRNGQSIMFLSDERAQSKIYAISISSCRRQ